MEAVSKPLMGLIDPFVLTFWRFSAGSLFFIFYPGMGKRFRELARFSYKQWTSVIFLGILNTFLAMSLLQLAVKHSNASTAAAIFCSNPGFVFIIAVLLGNEKVKPSKAIGFIMGVAGIMIIMSSRGFVVGYGVFYAVCAAVFFAIYTVLGKKTVSGITPATVNMASFPFGVLANGIFIGSLGKSFFPDPVIFHSPANISALIYLGVVVTGIGYITFFETIKRFSAVSASLIFMFKPVVALLISFIFLGEKAGLGFFAGLIAICFGTLLIVREKINSRHK
jgi:drug/metabolite transporter (DMT)-like permease